MDVSVQRPQNPSWEGFICKIPQKCCSSSNPPSSQLQPGSCSSSPSSSYQSQSLYTLLPPSPTRHLKNTTIIPALLCLHTCFVCIRFFPLFVNLPPLENQIESGWRVWLDTGFAAAARWLWIMRWWKYSLHSKHPTILLYKLHVGSKYATRAI